MPNPPSWQPPSCGMDDAALAYACRVAASLFGEEQEIDFDQVGVPFAPMLHPDEA